MTAQFDKVILIKDQDSEDLKAIIVHDTRTQKKTIYSVSEKSMDEILDLFNKNEPATT